MPPGESRGRAGAGSNIRVRTGRFIAVGGFGREFLGDAVLLVEPAAEIDQLASLAAEGTARRRAPYLEP